jgi:hypothetical protein
MLHDASPVLRVARFAELVTVTAVLGYKSAVIEIKIAAAALVEPSQSRTTVEISLQELPVPQ